MWCAVKTHISHMTSVQYATKDVIEMAAMKHCLLVDLFTTLFFSQQ